MATRLSELTTEANPPTNSLLAVVVNGITRKTFLSNVLGLVTGGTVTSISGGTNVSVTSSIASSPVFVTGLASNDTITAVGHRFVENQLIVFSNLVGGSPLVNGVAYGAVNVTSDTFKLLTIAGDPINITTNLTSGSVLPAEPTKNITVSFSFPGMIVPYAGLASKVPNGWLYCNGQTLSTTTYSDLFAVVGYTYGGSGGGFNVPDLRGRIPTNAYESGSLGSSGGVENVTLVSNQAAMKAHSHGYSGNFCVTGPGAAQCCSDGVRSQQEVGCKEWTRSECSQTVSHSSSLDSFSGANAVLAHNNMPPVIVLSYLIKT